MDVEEDEVLAKRREEFGKTVQKSGESLGRASNIFSKQYAELLERAKIYSEKAGMLHYDLGVNADPNIKRTRNPNRNDILAQDIAKSMDELNTNIRFMQGIIATIDPTKFDTVDFADYVIDRVQTYGSQAGLLSVYQTELDELVRNYATEAKNDISRFVDERSQTIVKETRLRLLDRRREEVASRRISFFGRLRGLGKLQEAELKAIDLERSIVSETPPRQKASYNVVQSLADMRVFAVRELGDQNTVDMERLITDTLKAFPTISRQDIESQTNEKLVSHPAVIEPKRMNTSKRIQRAEARNANLEATLIDVRKSCNNSNASQDAQSPTLTKFEKIVVEAIRNTTTKEMLQKQADELAKMQEQQAQKVKRTEYGDGYGR